MARKRNRETEDVDGDGDGEVEIESASSSFRVRQDKRTRVAAAQAAGTSVASEGDDYQDLLNSQAIDASDMDEDETEQQIDYSLRQNSSDVEQEDDAIDELAATQYMQKQQREHKENIPAECGIIEEIYCRNFMCHSNLRIRPGPLINFIIGHNGSGKSAVLTTLQVCLGENAKQTNRGKSLKDMVKEGTDSAMVGVKIKNRGEGAYKPELYGESIVVERNFNKTGSSGFKMKSATGTTITTRKADLDEILDYYGLQLDNPINVLTQDKARSFLADSSETEKYKFFIKGTQLELLNSDYTIIEENLDAVEAKIGTRKEDVNELKRQFDEADKRKKRIDDAANIHTRMKAIEREMAWAQIEEQEVAIQNAEKDVAGAEERVAEAERSAEAASIRFDSANTAKEGAERGLDEHQNQLVPAQAKFDSAKQKFDDNKTKLVKHKADERTIKEEFKKANSEIKTLEKEIAEERKRLAEEHGEAHTQRLQDLDEFKQNVDKAKQDIRDHESLRPELEQQLDEARQQHESSQRPVEAAQKNLDDAKRQLDRLRRDEGQEWAPYFQKMKALCTEIRRETRWRARPVGPMGMHVHLLKLEWASIIESTLGSTLNGFAVTCKEDQVLLEQISQRIGCPRGTVIAFIVGAAPLDFASKEPADDVDTILRVLRVEEDIVRNTLIINHSAEQTVLIKNNEEGKAWMYDNGRRRNVRAVITMAEKERGGGHRWEWTRGSDHRVGPVKKWGGLIRMKADKEEELRGRREDVQDAQQQLQQATEQQRDLQTALTRARQAVERHKKEQRAFTVALQKAEDDVESKQAEIDANRPRDGKLQELERQKQASEEEKQAASGSIEDMAVQKEKLDEDGAEFKSAVDAAQLELDTINGHIQRATARLQRTIEARDAALLEKNQAHDLVEHAKQEVVEKEVDLGKQRTTLEEWLPLAQEIAPERVPIQPGNTPESLSELHETLKTQYEEAERRLGGTREELVAAWHEARNQYDKARRTLRKLQTGAKVREVTVRYLLSRFVLTHAQKMKEALAERHRRWGLFRKYISMRTRIQFYYLLQERNFRGRVELNHAAKTLSINIEPDNTKASDSGRQAKTLSGGEKSFSTICLLLSIWEAMGSPIRCLDEFDVFMDSANRASSMGLMIKTARRSVGRQFILITPQAMGNVELGDDVNIYK